MNEYTFTLSTGEIIIVHAPDVTDAVDAACEIAQFAVEFDDESGTHRLAAGDAQSVTDAFERIRRVRSDARIVA